MENVEKLYMPYYITLAEEIFPVIEVSAGRTVDVVLSRGFLIP